MADYRGMVQRTLRRESRRKAASRPERAFGLPWVGQYLKRHLTVPTFSDFHAELAGDLAAARSSRPVRLNFRAPRGTAKTTIGTVGYALHGAVEGVEPFTLLLSESGLIAAGFLRTIKAELEENADLARDYPGAAGVGPVWRESHIVLRNGCCVVTRGVGGRIRGLRHGRHRPTLVIVDDGNEKADAYSPTQRKRKLDWMNKDVLSVGGPDTNFLSYGTPIHREAIVCELGRNPTWRSRAYKSVIRWPDRLDLWAEWERVLTNLADPDRLTAALEFYRANEAAMRDGAEVLWEGRENLYDLMLHRATIGPAAFASEKQDEPGTDGATEWDASLFDWPGLWFEDWPTDLVVKVQALDPSKGTGSKPGDYQAHVKVGLGAYPDNTLYVEADLRRETDWVGRALDLAREWGPAELVAETNATMGLLLPEIGRQLDDRAKAGRPQLLSVVEVHHAEPKLARIRGLGGYLTRRQIRVRNTPGGRLLVDQLRDCPSSEFDDGPDALSTAVRRLEELVRT